MNVLKMTKEQYFDDTLLSVMKYNETLETLPLHFYESIQLLMSLVTNIALNFATGLSS